LISHLKTLTLGYYYTGIKYDLDQNLQA